MDSNKYVFKAAALTSAFAAGAALSHLYHLRRTAAPADDEDPQRAHSSPSDESALPLLLHQEQHHQQQSSAATAVSSTTTLCGNGRGPGSATATGGGGPGTGAVGEPSTGVNGLAANGLGAVTTLGGGELEPDALLAGVELGGTSCRAAVAYARDPTKMIAVHEVPTTPDANATLSDLVTFLRQHVPFRAVGVASFGPVDLDKKSATYGYITTTPKPGWQNVNVLSYFSPLGAPLGFDTDVNAPALAELRYGGFVDRAPAASASAGEDSSSRSSSMNSCAYVTVGTGIGVGLVVDGKPVHGLVHPEGGHIMPLKRASDTYKGWSNIHRDSVESMASARACAERAGVMDPKLLATQVGDDDPVWDDVAYYLAQLCVTVCYVASPHVIVLSGGVMKRSVLFDKIRKQFETLNEGYIAVNKILNRLDEYIVPSKYGNDIGIIGAIELARTAALNMD